MLIPQLGFKYNAIKGPPMRIGTDGVTPNNWYAMIRGDFNPDSILADHPLTDDWAGRRERSDWLRENVLPQIVVIWTSMDDCEEEFQSYLEWDIIASPTCNEWNVYRFSGTRPIEHRTVNRAVGNLITLDYHHPWWDFIAALDQNTLERETHYHRIR